MQVLSILMRNIPTLWSGSLHGFSNDTRATKLVNNRFLEAYTGSVVMIFKQCTLNGKRRVSNGKWHVIQRKQTRENVCGLCLNANSCNSVERLILYAEYLSINNYIKGTTAYDRAGAKCPILIFAVPWLGHRDGIAVSACNCCIWVFYFCPLSQQRSKLDGDTYSYIRVLYN